MNSNGSLSTLDLIFSSSPVVMMVLLVLVSFSVLCWAILYFKWYFLRRCHRYTEEFLDLFWSGKEIEQIYSDSKKYVVAPVAKIFQSGYTELQRLMEKESRKDGPKNRLSTESSLANLERALGRATRLESMRLESSLTFLATTGSTAPFIGLFGTVWGIMNAFQNIGAQGAASLAVVAPGIAEALIATAVGLLCAIPAVMGYNYFVNKVRAFKTEMDNFSADYLNILKRNYFTA